MRKGRGRDGLRAGVRAGGPGGGGALPGLHDRDRLDRPQKAAGRHHGRLLSSRPLHGPGCALSHPLRHPVQRQYPLRVHRQDLPDWFGVDRLGPVHVLDHRGLPALRAPVGGPGAAAPLYHPRRLHHSPLRVARAHPAQHRADDLRAGQLHPGPAQGHGRGRGRSDRRVGVVGVWDRGPGHHHGGLRDPGRDAQRGLDRRAPGGRAPGRFSGAALHDSGAGGRSVGGGGEDQ